MKAMRWFLLTVLISVVCGLSVGAPAPAVATADYASWTDLGIVYSAPSGDAYYPSVIYDASGFGGGSPLYKMWYSDGSGAAFVVTSGDGLSWGGPSSLTELGGDAHHVQVVYDENCFGASPCDGTASKYKIWYWDTDAPLYSISAMATAESTDGVAWTNDTTLTQSGTSLVTGAGTGWNRGSYGPIDVFYQAGASNTGSEPWDYSYVMYYDGTDGGREVTGLAYSLDGLDWTAYSANPVLDGSTAAAWDCSDSAYGTVYQDSNGYHFWYSGGGGDDGAGGCQDHPVHEGIGYASSSDGKTWTKDAGNPIFHISDGVSYRNSRVYTPAVVDNGSGLLRMYYSALASEGPKKIGLAVNAEPPTTTFVDDDWAGLPLLTQVNPPGDPNPHYIGLDAFATVQEGIDGVVGSTVDVYPGTYNQDEANGYDPNTGGAGSNDFNIFVNKAVTIRGVDGSGAPITDYHDVQAHIIAKRQLPTFGQSAIFIQADGVTIAGLEVTGWSDTDNNKTVEVVGDNVTVRDCVLHGLDSASALYFDDRHFDSGTNTSHLQSYHVEENLLDGGGPDADGIRISSGAGWSGPVSGRVISGNTFSDTVDGIAFVGPGGDPWDVYPVGDATITGNDFSLSDRRHVVAWGEYPVSSGNPGYVNLDWTGILASNTFDKGAMIWTPSSDARAWDSGSFKYVRGLYSAIQRYAINKAQAGDTVQVLPGTYDETLRFDSSKASDLSVIGADAATTFITGGIRFEGDHSGLTVENFTITGDGRQRPGLAEATVGESSGGWVVTNARFANNVFDGEGITGVGGGRFGFYLSRLGGSFTFEDNEVKDYRGWGTLELNQSSSTVTSYVFTDNNVHDNSGSSALRGNPSDRTDTVTATGNVFDNNGGGDSWASLEINEAETVTVSDNSITNTQAGNWGEGEALQFWHITSLTVTDNTIENNHQGIYFPGDAYASDLSGVEIHGNSISGNTEFGFQADAGNTGTADAEDNWWGSANGPTHTSNTFNVGSQGDVVSDNVDFVPWLDAAPPGGTSFAPVTTTNPTDSYASIQAGVDGSNDNGTVNAKAGTYTETIDVDGRSHIDVVGEDRDTVIVKPGSTLCWNLPGYDCGRQVAVRVVNSTDIGLSGMTFDFDLVKADGVTGALYWDSTGVIDDNILKNMSVPDTLSGGYSEITTYIRAPGFTDGARAAVTVSNNVFQETGRVAVLTHDFANTTIQDNTFSKTIDDFGYAVEIGSRSTGTISGNTISGYDIPAASDGSESAGVYIENAFTGSHFGGVPHVDKPVIISGNTITANQYGLWLGNEYDTYAGDVDISITLQGNDIHDNLEAGVYVVDEDRADGSSVTLNASGNTVSNNGNEGYHFFTYRDGEIHAVVSGDTISGQQTGVLVDECVDGDDMCPAGASASLYDVVIGPNNDISDNDTGVGVFSVPGITVQGNEIHDNVNRSGYAGAGIMFWGDSDNEQVLNNVVHDNDRQGIFLGHDTAISTGNTISGNTIYHNGLNTNPNPPDASAYGIQLWNADSNIVTNNEVYGHDDWEAYPGFDFAQGIYLFDSNDNLLSGNILRDNNYGVGLWGPSRGDGSNLINFNTIAGNTGYGVRNFDALTVNAENNWWGACDGPSGSGPGSGDAVSNYVDYDPWLHGGCDYDGDKLSDDQERQVIGTDWQNPDTDGDGCNDGREYVSMPGFSPLVWYDFYDVPVPANADMTPNGPRDKAVNVQDVVGVTKYVGTSNNGPANANGVDYDSDKDGDTVKDGVAYDRSPGALPNPPYEAGPPSGAVNLQDVVVVLRQVGLSCQ
jgi:parallel beta-helix repeat protein